MFPKTIQEDQTEERKMALCVAHTDLARPFHLWQPVMLDRAAVDDPNFINPTIKQLIPYVTFTRTVNGVPCVLTYQRGNAETASPERTWRSVGFGGHIDVTAGHWGIDDPWALASTILEVVYKKIGWMLSTVAINYEDLGLALYTSMPTRSTFFNKLNEIFSSPPNKLQEHYLDVRYAPGDAAHLGLSFVLDLDGFELSTTFDPEEKNKLIDLRWVPLADFEDPNCGLDYEGWSRHVMSKLTGFTYLQANKDCYRERTTDAMPKPFPRYGT